MTPPTTAPASSAALAGNRSSVLVQAALAMLFGMFIVFTVGFAHSDILHNAAHDVRHSNAFPCH
jgi:cobalt transporter subunit CbtB